MNEQVYATAEIFAYGDGSDPKSAIDALIEKLNNEPWIGWEVVDDINVQSGTFNDIWKASVEVRIPVPLSNRQ